LGNYCAAKEQQEGGEFHILDFGVKVGSISANIESKAVDLPQHTLKTMGAKQFKYADFLGGLSDCPPADCKEVEMTAFRFVKADLNHSDNFKPVKAQQPNRHFDSDKANCLAWGLSMFSDKEMAIFFYQQRLSKFPRFSAVVGGHIATVSVMMENGVASQPGGTGFWPFHVP
jgi:hypothetical protein